MKKRNLVIVAFLLVAAMTLGIGYAVLTGTLTVKGDAQYNKEKSDNAFESDLIFSDAKQTTHGSAYAAGTHEDSCSASGQLAQFSVQTLATTADQAVFTYTLTNHNNVGVDIVIAPSDGVTANPDLMESFNVVVDFPAHLDAGKSGTVTVTVTLKAAPSSNISIENYVLNLTATASAS